MVCPEKGTRPSQELSELVEFKDFPIIVAPDKQLPFQYTAPSDLTIRLSNPKRLLDDFLDTDSVRGRVFATFREDLDVTRRFGQINMYLAVLSIVLSFQAYSPPAHHLAAVLDAPGLVEVWAAYLDSNTRSQVFDGLLIQHFDDVRGRTRWERMERSRFEERYSCFKRILEEQ